MAGADEVRAAVHTAFNLNAGSLQQIVQRLVFRGAWQPVGDEGFGACAHVRRGVGLNAGQQRFAVRPRVEQCLFFNDRTADGLVFSEIDVREGSDHKRDAGHEEDEDAAGRDAAVEGLLGFHGHEAHDELRLRQHADTYAHDDGRDHDPPEMIPDGFAAGAAGGGPAEGRHGGPAPVADRGQGRGHAGGQVGQRLVRGCEAAELGVGEDQQEEHADQHDCALQRIRQHDPFDAACDDVGGDHDSEHVQGGVVRDVEDRRDELGAADNDRHGVERHEAEDDEGAEHLNQAAAVPLAHQFRKGMGVQVVAHTPCRITENDKGDEDAHEDVEHGEPENPHAEVCGRTAESYDGRGADEGCAVREGHDDRVGVASGHQIV